MKAHINACGRCAKAHGTKNVPCMELRRRYETSKQPVLYAVNSIDIGGGSGVCPWIADWNRIVDLMKKVHQGKQVYANDTGSYRLKKIYELTKGSGSGSTWENLRSAYWAKSAEYVKKNGRLQHGSDCLLAMFAADDGYWMNFLEYYACNISIPGLYLWAGAGVKTGSFNPTTGKGSDTIHGWIWNKETFVKKSITITGVRSGVGGQANAGTPCGIRIIGSKNPAELIGHSYKGGFDVNFSTGVGWIQLIKTLFKKGAAKSVGAIVKKIVKAGGEVKPSASDMALFFGKSGMALSGTSPGEAIVQVFDAPIGVSAEATLISESAITVKSVS